MRGCGDACVSEKVRRRGRGREWGRRGAREREREREKGEREERESVCVREREGGRVYIYIYRERERGKENEALTCEGIRGCGNACLPGHADVLSVVSAMTSSSTVQY